MKTHPGRPIASVRRWGEPGRPTRAVLLHGFMAGANAWRPLAEELAGHGWRVWAPRVAPATEADAGFDSLCAALDAAIRECAAEGGEAAPMLYGYSMGGRLALEYLQRYPDAPVGLLALESAGFGPRDAAEREAFRERSRRWAARFRTTAPAEYVAWWESLGIFATQAELPAPVRACQRRERMAVPPETLAALTLAAGQGEMHSEAENRGMLARRGIALWYLAGERDVKYVEVARLLARDMGATAAATTGAEVPTETSGVFEAAGERQGAVSGARSGLVGGIGLRGRVDIVRGAGHNVHLERPGVLTQALVAIAERAGVAGAGGLRGLGCSGRGASPGALPAGRGRG